MAIEPHLIIREGSDYEAVITFKKNGATYALTGTIAARFYKNDSTTPAFEATVANSRMAVNAGAGTITFAVPLALLAGLSDRFGSIVFLRTGSGDDVFAAVNVRYVPANSALATDNATFDIQTATLNVDYDTTYSAALAAKADASALAAKLDTSAAPELIRDTMGTALVAGANITITPNDAGDTITIAATGGGGTVAGKNRIINGAFQVNQRVVSGTVTLAAGAYGHDCWKAGASGCTYTYSTNNGKTTITISEGSLQHVIEGKDVPHGNVVLSWTGTAQGKIGAGSYAASGVTASVTGGSNLTVEFGTGTLANVQLEAGTVATAFEFRHFAHEEELCLSRCKVFGGLNSVELIGMGFTPLTNYSYAEIKFPTTMRAIPSWTVSAFSDLCALQPGVTLVPLTGLTGQGATRDSYLFLCEFATNAQMGGGKFCLLAANQTLATRLIFSADL